ncbi:LysE family translocator [Tropicimonas isoalkanivorans]|uniref:Putative LysE/RhtB family amino acid efflux pump n=1 Tax=Tropicimonas isoalkanivorans TaxID=441112 RepID=A0A1I1G9H7_9RHOB|nr:LysE family transporter [Tropicimonas isoalkanivorans]SFC05800.1 putative LysE/RhtB family amino acid efflux pump [Tropicimonas isoalkanivorans]
MIPVLLKGMGVGFAIAAPVGPIGVLCIRRTLARGRAAGLATGLGAATADAVYGLLVAAGFTATGVLMDYSRPMAISGGFLMALLGVLSLRGYWAARHAPAPPAATGGRPYRGLTAAWATTFVLTLSNPTTILAFIGMVAALGSAASGAALAPYVLVFGVFAGSATWWLLLVHMASYAGARVNADALRWLDLASGSLLLAWGIWIAATAV